MDTTVSITNSRENELQFDISVEGTDVSEMRARFVIEMGDVEYVFPCKQSDTAARWNVKIPKMPHLKTGTYDFHVEIITNGYYFDPYKGKIEITPEPTVSQSDVSKKVPVPTVKAVVVKGEDKKEEKKEESVKEDIDKKSADLVSAFLKNKKVKLSSTVTESDKDKAAKAVLKEMKKPAKKSTEKIELAPVKKRVTESNAPPKKRVVKKRKVVVKEDTTSALDKAIENIDVPKDEQALKVRNIINSVKDEE